MDYKGHFKTGSVFGLIALDKISGGDLANLSFLEPLSIGAIGLGIAIGSGLPDIDHHNSLLAKKLKFLGWLISRFFSHRGFTHSITFIIVIYLSFTFGESFVDKSYLQAYRCLAFSTVFGITVHILMDMFIGNGVRLLSPIFQKRFYFTKIRSSSKSEAAFHKFLIFCLFIYLIIRSDLGDEMMELLKSIFKID